jgi:hypothetical protein
MNAYFCGAVSEEETELVRGIATERSFSTAPNYTDWITSETYDVCLRYPFLFPPSSSPSPSRTTRRGFTPLFCGSSTLVSRVVIGFEPPACSRFFLWLLQGLLPISCSCCPPNCSDTYALILRLPSPHVSDADARNLALPLPYSGFF